MVVYLDRYQIMPSESALCTPGTASWGAGTFCAAWFDISQSGEAPQC